MDCAGSAMMYSSSSSSSSSPGFLNWEYAGLLASQVGSDSNAECRPASHGESCDQIGATCRSWECPDFFTVPGLGGRFALKWSDQVWPLFSHAAGCHAYICMPLHVYATGFCLMVLQLFCSLFQTVLAEPSRVATLHVLHTRYFNPRKPCSCFLQELPEYMPYDGIHGKHCCFPSMSRYA